MIIAESPGSNEERENKPFVGDAGELLAKALPIPIDSDQLYITNAFCCRPFEKDATLLKRGTTVCHDRLMGEILSHPRDVILTLGGPALWSVTGNYNLKITRERGQTFPSELATKGIFTALHPAFLLRGGGNYNQFVADIARAFNAIGIETPPSSLHDFKPDPADVIKEPKYTVVNEMNFDDTVMHLHQRALLNGAIIGDLETTGFDRQKDDILAFGVCTDPEEVFIFDPDWMYDPQFIKQLVENPELHWVWHNGKFDIAFEQYRKIKARVDDDTMLMNYSLNEHPGFHDLEQVAMDLLEIDPYKKMLDIHLPYKGASYAHVPKPILYEYLAKDCSSTLQIYRVLKQRVDEDAGLVTLNERTLVPASNFLVKVESRGLPIDLDKLDINRQRLIKEIASELTFIHDISQEKAGVNLNPNAFADVAVLLYDKMGLRAKRRGKRNTRKETLEKLVPPHPIVPAILKYRTLLKQKSTTVEGFARHMGVEGRIYPTFLLHGSKTGRLAARKPNVMNIPRAKTMRDMVRSRPGRLLLKADLDQAELRVLAVCSQDEFLMRVFGDNSLNLHDEMSDFLFGKGWTEEQRMRSKAVNFGIPYGREAASLASEFDVPFNDAQQWIYDWFKRAPEAEKFLKRCADAVIKGETLSTAFGRKRRFGVISKNNLHELINEAKNFPIQGMASDITLHAAMNSDDVLENDFDTFIFNLVHDEILSDTPDEETAIESAKVIQFEVQRAASGWLSTDLPFPVSFSIGTHWGSLEKLDVAA